MTGAHEELDERFVAAVKAMSPGGLRAGVPVDEAWAWFDAQAGSRHLDFAARSLQARGHGFYTIGSAGHESNAVLAAALRPTDPALLHYRSGGFYLRRARQVPGIDPLRDVLLGLVASAREPISGGRHKVFGRHELSVIPLTSTVASHVPRAVGIGFAIGRAARLGVDCVWPADAVVVTSFGDASANHSTAVGAINAAAHAAFQGVPMPVLFVCEDNGLGISVPTPAGWVAAALSSRPHLRYLAAEGDDPAGLWETAREAVEFVRERRAPAVLHVRTVRFLGHAGADVEAAYRSPAALAADLAKDPLVACARLLVETGAASPVQVLDRYEGIRAEVARLAAEVVTEPRLASAAEVVAPLAPRSALLETTVAAPAERRRVFGARLPEDEGPLTLAQSINRALADTLAAYPEALVFGEDVGRKGGVYGVTRGLQKRFGTARVFDTLLDEQTILGVALGAGVSGLLPIPEIQYLAYLHNAEDQLRGEAATMQFFSVGRYRNPMVVRIAGYAYQKGFGGHFHNDNAVGALRDVPGLVIASPSRPEDAAGMLRACVAAARTDGAVCVFLEPIALYHTRDLHTDGDDGWRAAYDPAALVPIGRARTHGDGSDLTIVTFGNGLPMSLRVAHRLAAAGIRARVLDLRWLAPLPVDDILREADATGAVLVVDETRRTGGVAEGVLTALVDAGYRGAMARVTSADSFIPLGPAARHVLVDEPSIEKAARTLLGATGPPR